MAVQNLTPDIGVGASDYILCAGRSYIFEEDDANAVFIEWMVTTSVTGVDPNSVTFSNKEGRRTLIKVPITGRYSVFTDLEVLP